MRRMLGVLILLAGCGASAEFKQARHYEKVGRLFEAVRVYERFIARHPEDARVSEARVRTARIYAQKMDLCEKAVPHFERAARAADSGWSEDAKLGLLTCPDFFPLYDGAQWTYVDSLSGGVNMRLEVRIKKSSANVSGRVAGAYYAGKIKFRDYRRSYEKKGWTVWEFDGTTNLPILRWPYRKGQSWEHRVKKDRYRYRIVADNLRVRTKGGRFKGCLKVKEHKLGFPSWVYNYYCPGVGRVKTTIGVPGVENPNTELAKYRAAT
ncbi:MAG: tetratricopeptide repeat protein [Elusimicrobiota bacterium]